MNKKQIEQEMLNEYKGNPYAFLAVFFLIIVGVVTGGTYLIAHLINLITK